MAAPIPIRVLLFARYAELLGAPEVTVEVVPPATLGAVVEAVRRLPGGAALPARPLGAVNRVHADPAAPVAAGDEVALLPPLAGG